MPRVQRTRVVVRRVNMIPAIAAQPYLRPGWEKGRDALKGRVAAAIGRLNGDLGRLEEELDVAVREAAAVAHTTAIQRCPVDTGRLRSSINIQKRNVLHYTVGTNVRYARHVEFGTKAHGPILPVRKKALSFEVVRR